MNSCMPHADRTLLFSIIFYTKYDLNFTLREYYVDFAWNQFNLFSCQNMKPLYTVAHSQSHSLHYMLIGGFHTFVLSIEMVHVCWRIPCEIVFVTLHIEHFVFSQEYWLDFEIITIRCMGWHFKSLLDISIWWSNSQK